jgi:predicted amidohydrolase
VVGTDAVLGTIQGGAWKGRLHSGCSLVARPDGTAAIVAKFKQPDLIVFDIPAGQVSKPTFGKGWVKIGGVQLAGMRGDKTNNIAKAERMIRDAAAQGAQVIMTPEVALTGFVGGEQERAMAEPIPGPTSEHFGQLAKELEVYLLVGMSELRADPAGKPSQTQLCNAMPVFSPGGDLMGVMRKVHINRYETGGGWRNGSDFPVWDFRTPTGQFRGGIMVCYDRELPESARILMLEGADVIFNPLACGCPTSDIHRCLLRTRAFENELFVFMVNHAAPRENGHSMVFDFKGDIVKEMDDKEGVFVYDLDLDALNKHREKGIYAFHHRRPELYGILSDPAGQVHPPEANLPPTQ